MNILVIEPHADDAFLSLGWHLERRWARHNRTILTVYIDTLLRGTEARRYARAIGANHHCLELPGRSMDSKVPPAPIEDISLAEFFKPRLFDRVYIPLGLQHPDHLSVAMTSLPFPVWYYLDIPYAQKLKNQNHLRSAAKGLAVESILFPPEEKWRHVGIFYTQRVFFHHHDGIKLCPEIVLGCLSVDEKTLV